MGEPDLFSCVGFHRRLGRPPFTPRQRLIADIALREVPWLHHAGLPGADHQGVPPLTARQRTVLTLLLHGRTRRQIADQLRLSTHTVHGYTRQVYRHFHVHARSELFARFMGPHTQPPSPPATR